jgi:site-specific DNA recombinase
MTEYFDCYIRVSTQEQTKGFSLETQEEVGRKLAKGKKLKFRLRNEGGRSSTIHYRPVLEELKDDIEKGRVKHLWVYDRSRLFRNLNDSLFFRKDYLDKYKVSFYEGVVGNEVNFDSLEEKLAYDLISQLQQYENEKRSQKSKQGKRHLLQQGVSNRHYGGTGME